MPLSTLCLCVIVLVSATGVAQAQTTDPGAEARFHVGPVALQPKLRIGDVGLDSNVLNSASQPQRDFTATFIPGLDSWMHIGRVALSGKTSAEMLFFARSASQRSFGFSQEGRADWQLTRMMPFVSGGMLTTFERPNVEIDARVKQQTSTVRAGVKTQLSPTMRLEIGLGQVKHAFADVTFDGVPLPAVLDRTQRVGDARVWIDVTPLTAVAVAAQVDDERFPGASIRDGRSVSFVSTVSMKRSAIVSGSASFGFRRFTPVDARLPGYTGPVADVNMHYFLRDMTQFSVSVARGTDFSFSPDEPYFVLTSAGLSVTQVVANRVELTLRGSRANMQLRHVALDDGTPVAGHVERLTTVGAGVAYRLASGVRIGFEVTQADRRSPVADRGYHALRWGGTFTYGY